MKIGIGSLAGALLTGVGAWLKYSRSLLTKDEHREVCELRTAPILTEIAHLKDDVGELRTSTDDSSAKLDRVIDILLTGKDKRL